MKRKILKNCCRSITVMLFAFALVAGGLVTSPLSAFAEGDANLERQDEHDTAHTGVGYGDADDETNHDNDDDNNGNCPVFCHQGSPTCGFCGDGICEPPFEDASGDPDTDCVDCYDCVDEHPQDGFCDGECEDENDNNICDDQECEDRNHNGICDVQECVDSNHNGICDSQECPDVNNNDICDQQECTDANNNNICDQQECLDANNDGICDAQNCTDANDDGICDSENCTDANNNGICDQQECLDANTDGICDAQNCTDANNNNLCDEQECTDANNDGICDAQNCPDTNNNQICDQQECQDTNNNNICDQQECPDTNRNGVCDSQECPDTNNNQICDSQECPDADNDGICDSQETVPPRIECAGGKPGVEPTVVQLDVDGDGDIDVTQVTCPRDHEVCFDPETRILMGDGKTEKRIADIVLGDKAWNPVTKQAVAIESVTIGSELPPMLEIGYGDKTVFVTQGHPMVVGADLSAFRQAALGGIETKMNGYQVKKAIDITKADHILGSDGKLHKVTTLKLRPIQKDQTVWNITLASDSSRLEDRMIVANGIVTGDVKIQVKLVRAKK